MSIQTVRSRRRLRAQPQGLANLLILRFEFLLPIEVLIQLRRSRSNQDRILRSCTVSYTGTVYGLYKVRYGRATVDAVYNYMEYIQ